MSKIIQEKSLLFDWNLNEFFFSNTAAANNAMKKLAVSLADSTDLRVILGVLYIMTEVLRNHEDEEVRESFIQELSKVTFDS